MEKTPVRREPRNQEPPRQPRVIRARQVDAFAGEFPPLGGEAAGRAGARPRQPVRSGHSARKAASRRKGNHPFLYATVIMLCTLGLLSVGLFMAPQALGIYWKDMPNYGFANGNIIAWDADAMAAYISRRGQLNQDTIYPGVTVDGVAVGNMSVGQAREALGAGQAQAEAGFSLTVHIGDRAFPINSQLVPLTRNVDQVLEKAYALGRQNSTDILNTQVTPFAQRLGQAGQLAGGVHLTSEMTYDKAAVRELTNAMVSYVNRPAVDAAVSTFDFNARSFTFSEESAGVYVDAEELYRQVIAKLDSGEYGQVLTVTPEITTPRVTKVELMNSFKRIATYTTETTSNSNRNTNIDLSAQALNGRTVMPGETFSFNEATGQRTVAKGYKEAIAIAGGQNVPDIGGGVCQTSSTLFNAVARADLEIVSRSPHAWPSSYVAKGLDATVNWPNLDFKFRNNKDTPIFIISYYNSRKVTVEIYGMSLGTGVTIDLTSEVTKTVRPPSDVKYVQNANLAPGTSKQTIEARTGYVVDTYKVWYRDGQEIKREKLFTSNYKAYQRTVEYN